MKTNILFILMTLLLSATVAKAYEEHYRYDNEQISDQSRRGIWRFARCGAYDIFISGFRYPPREEHNSNTMYGKWGKVYLYKGSEYAMNATFITELLPKQGSSNSYRFASADLSYAFIATGDLNIDKYLLILPGSGTAKCVFGSYLEPFRGGWRTKFQ